jgi:hypothetical protein
VRNRSETVSVMTNPGKGDIPQPSLPRCSFLSNEVAHPVRHIKKKGKHHFDTVPLRPNQSFCNIDRGSEKLAQLPLPASRQPPTTLKEHGLSAPPSSHPHRDKKGK